MNKIVTSVGLLALGASALHAAESSTLNQYQDTKAWSVQATLRGFYDDNVAGIPGGDESAGFEVSPSVKFGMPGEHTSFNVGYSFSGKFYDKNTARRDGKSDYTHTFDADLSHAFSPRFDVALSEAFVIGQEPDYIQDPALPQRIDGDNIRNFANVDFNLAVTDLLGFGFGYRNGFYDYDDEGGTAAAPSNSGLLDRLEHTVKFDTRWKLTPQTVGIVGYSYSQINYTGDEPITATEMSDSRDSQGHTIYVGAQHTFNPSLAGTLLVGGQQYSYDRVGVDSEFSPYVQGSLTYTIESKTSLEAGVQYSRSPANIAGAQDTETAQIYATLRQQIASKLIGSLNGTYSDSKYNGGGVTVDGKHQVYSRLGLDLAYEFTQNLSGHLGYNYDEIDSDLPGRSYDRNRVYLGVTAGF
jgi:hypothetical protein